MGELARVDIPLQRTEVPRDEAVALFSEMGEQYKGEIIRDLPPDSVISLYGQGDFVDLCRGPHAVDRAYQSLQANESSRRLLAWRFA